MQRKFHAKGIFATALTLFLCLSILTCNYAVFAEEADAVQKKDENAQEVQKQESTEAAVQEQTDAAEEKEAQEIKSEVKTNSESAEKADAAKNESTDGTWGGGVTDTLKPRQLRASRAEQKRAEQNNVITSIEALLQDGSGPVGNTITQWQVFRIKAYFKLPNDTVKAGDTTTVKLPEELKFNQTIPFRLTDADDNVVAEAVVDGDKKTLTLTYTDYPEKHSDVSGDFFFYVRMDRKVVDGEIDIPLDFVINNQVISAGTVHFEGYPTPSGSIVSKSGTQETVANVNGNRAWFQINVNTKGENLTDVSIVDKLMSKGITVDTKSIKIRKGEWKVEKGDLILVNQTDVTKNYTIAFDPDDSGFSVNLGNVSSDEGYQIVYYVHSDYELVDGERIDNNVVLHGSNVGELSADAKITWAVAGGSAAGYVYKIKIKKVEKGDDSKVLAGAVFEVKRVVNDDVVGKITTDSNGEGELGGLLKDKYELTEKTPPDGYKRLNAPITVSTDDFDSDKVALMTVENEPAETSVSVEKQWIGKAGKSATVILYRRYESNGVVTEEATGLSKELNKGNQWKATFENLEKHAPDGSEYEYYIKESPMSGYSPEIQNKGDNSFVVVNTNIETINISVKKTWIGEPSEGAKIVLTADGKQKDEVAVGTDDGWTHTFTGLPIYDPVDGHQYNYDVKETGLDGEYIKEREGSVCDGFSFTNTITGTTEVEVKKEWIGPEKDEVVINLMDGTKIVDTVTLSADNDWQHRFTGLDKYRDGKEIEYKIQEEKIENYDADISGSIKDGFVVTNTNTETLNIPVAKKWIGKPANNVVIKLLSDGKVIESVTLDETTEWKYTFTDLPVYDNADGHEIVYDVQEEDQDGYISEITGDADKGYVITNTYIPPEKPTPPEKTPPTEKSKTTTPKTGDTNTIGGFVIMMLVSFGALVAAVLKKKKSNL